MSEEEKEIVIEDAEAVLAGEPTIRERLDKLEQMMEQILSRLPYMTAGYATTANYPYYVTTTTGTTTSNPVWINNTSGK